MFLDSHLTRLPTEPPLTTYLLFHRAGVLNATVPLELSLYLMNEKDYVPWATALEHFQSWSKRLSESKAYKLFLEYMRQLLGPITKFVGWDDKGLHLHK